MHTRYTGNSLSLPLADDSVDTIITDPPWHFDLRVSPKAKAVKATQYPLIVDRELSQHFYEMRRVLKPGGHLFLFCPEQKQQDAEFALMMSMAHSGSVRGAREPQLRRVTSLVWVKTTKDRERARIGLGHTIRMAHELILFWSNGRRRPMAMKNLPSVLGYERSGGSIKPAELYERIARASCPPGGTLLDPWCGSDPLGKAHLDDYTTISGDIQEWEGA